MPNAHRTPEVNKERGLELEAKCIKCRPELLFVNALALNVYSHVKGQLIISGMGDVVSINLLAVEKFIDLAKYKNKTELLTKVMGLSEAVINFQNEKKAESKK